MTTSSLQKRATCVKSKPTKSRYTIFASQIFNPNLNPVLNCKLMRDGTGRRKERVQKKNLKFSQPKVTEFRIFPNFSSISLKKFSLHRNTNRYTHTQPYRHTHIFHLFKVFKTRENRGSSAKCNLLYSSARAVEEKRKKFKGTQARVEGFRTAKTGERPSAMKVE